LEVLVSEIYESNSWSAMEDQEYGEGSSTNVLEPHPGDVDLQRCHWAR